VPIYFLEEGDELVVILEPDLLEDRLQSLNLVDSLLSLEDLEHIKLLQLLVCEVDAKLLERILLEVLETENIQQPDALEIRLLRHEFRVNPLNKERESAVVEQFGKSVTSRHALLLLHRSPDDLL
jgi:hypothetical protein